MSEDLGATWNDFMTSRGLLRAHYKRLVLNAVTSIIAKRSPKVHRELLTIYGLTALNSAIELCGVLDDPATEFESMATPRIERSLEELVDRIDDDFDVGNTTASVSEGAYELTWSTTHRRSFRSESDAKEFAGSLGRWAVLARPDRTYVAFDKGDEEEIRLR